MQAIKVNSETDGLERSFRSVVIFWSILLLIYSAYCGILFDHKHYVEQWQLMLSGGDPWSTDNTYGPLHNIVGYLFLIHPFAPKLFMVGSLLIANFYLLSQLLFSRREITPFIVYALAIPVNVLTLGIGIVFGLNDSLVAALLVFAVFSRLKNKEFFTGLFLALAALMKFYPLFLTPLFVLESGFRIRWKIGFWTVGIFIIGMLFSYVIWGPSLFDVIRSGAGRGPSFMSILAVGGRHWGDEMWFQWLVRYNIFIVAMGIGIIFGYCFWRQVLWLPAVVIGYLVLLSLYKVGHQQFFLGWLFLVPCLYFLRSSEADLLAIILIPIIVFLSVVHFAFDLGTNLLGNRPDWLKDVGFVVFPVEMISIAVCLIVSWNNENASLEISTQMKI